MSHYEERLENDLKSIRENISRMAEKVEAGVKNSIHALQTRDEELATATILADHSINRAMRRIDKQCHAFIALHLPSAGHLRLLSSVIRANIELERVGDYAVTIARETLQLSSPPSGPLALELDRVGSLTLVMLRQAISAFNELSAGEARATMVLEGQIENDLDLVYAELMTNDDQESVKNLVRVFAVFNQFKRIADQAKNLCEETVFAATGEMKTPKVYNILFVDEDGSNLTPMAVAIARKHFPGSGNYSSVSRQPVSELSPALIDFLDQHSTRLETASPRSLDLTPLELMQQHVVVSLQGPVSSYFELVPYHTTPVAWEIAPAPADSAAFDGWLEQAYRDLAMRIRDLMVLLRGEDAP